jgi:GrpB-like predicted nucleotidyltransferase (UPF0157 family)
MPPKPTPKTIEVVPYDPLWPQLFQKEETLIKNALQDNCLEVHHSGSTAVPGLSAKPVIDIIMVVKDADTALAPLTLHGYNFKGEFNIPFRSFFKKQNTPKIHLHMYPEEYQSEVRLNLAFRDYLRTHPEAVTAYTQLKYSLLAQPQAHEKNNSPFAGYTLGKDPFIRNILAQTDFHKLRIVHCTHHHEWQETEKFRKKYQLSLTDFIEIYASTEHIHLALYKGITIVGYIHLEVLPQGKIVFHLIALEEAYENLRQQFLEFCSEWLKKKGYECTRNP